MRKKTLIKYIEAILVFVFFIFLFFAISEGVKRSEKNECLKWQEWQNQYGLFIAGKSQKEQCINYQINLK